MRSEQVFNYIMEKLIIFRWDDGDVCFVLSQHDKLDFNSAGSLKHEIWNNNPLIDMLLHTDTLSWFSQAVLSLLLNVVCLAEK